MQAANYSTVRNNFKDYCDKATKDFETILITRERGDNVVLMSEAEYNNLPETGIPIKLSSWGYRAEQKPEPFHSFFIRPAGYSFNDSIQKGLPVSIFPTPSSAVLSASV